MDIQVKTSEFLKAIQTVEGVITTRQIKSILHNIRITVSDSKVYLFATDMEISLRTNIDCDVIKPGDTTLPAKQLSSIFKSIQFSDSRITIKESSDNITAEITDATNVNKTKFQIIGQSPEEMSSIDFKVGDNYPSIPTDVFNEMIKKSFFAVAMEETRFIFNGLFLKSIGDNFIAVGTDGRRLAKIIRKTPTQLKIGEEKGIIVPHKTIREISKIIPQDDFAKIAHIQDQFYLKVGNTELMSKLIEGNYPDYDQVIPKNTKHSVLMDKDNFNIVLKQALISAEEPARQIRLHFQKNLLTVTSTNPGTMQYENSIPIEYNDEELIIAFRGDYLVDCLKAIEDPNFEIQFSSPNQPVVIKDPSDVDFVAVVMPMKI